MPNKITRVTQQPFGTSGPTGDFGAFGSKAVNPSSPIFTQNPTTIQSLAPFQGGWGEAIIGDYEPAMEDMNGLFLLAFYQIGYILQMGIAEYDSGTTYFINSIVQYNGLTYQSLTNNNLGNTPNVGTNWALFPAPNPFVKITNTQASGTGGGATEANTWATVPLNSIDTDTSNISSLNNNQVTLPAGSYIINGFVPLFCSTNGFSGQIRLINSLNPSVSLLNGVNTYISSTAVQTNSLITGNLVLAESTALIIQYHINQSDANGLGVPLSLGSEVYATLQFTKVA